MTEEEEKEAQKKAVEELNQACKDSDNSYFTYLINLTTVATGLLGLLVSLKSNEAITLTSKLLFVITILLLAFGIVFSMITQYKEVHNDKENLRYLSKSFRNKNYKKTFLELVSMDFEYTPPTKLFSRTEISSYILLALAFITLILYVISLEFQF
ncbi:hypothetical protein [Flavobacterium limnophilum]|uniref:hypothetical protein n=1 Tax=Flavobacterium limnophilum TaxID=3003262 RepID=UPI002482C337|nr:hypothetical protein [Flavobacterium limnophilum]